MKITALFAREIFDSRGTPTIECTLVLDDQIPLVSSVPSGTSRGKHEAVELRDGGDRWMGLGVSKAVKNITDIIAPAIVGKTPSVIAIDKIMMDIDGTENKSKLGANAMIAVSMVVCKAEALVHGVMLPEMIATLCGFDTIATPLPMINLIEGGVHACNKLAVQEFMVVAFNQKSFADTLQAGMMIRELLKETLLKNNKSIALGLEGGFAPDLADEFEALEYITHAINGVEQAVGGRYGIALDIAASQRYNAQTKKYTIGSEQLSLDQLMGWYDELIQSYPIFSLEDAVDENDWDGWHQLMEQDFAEEVQIVGDDILVTNPARIVVGIEEQIMSAAIIKPNQVGTVTETLQAIQLCQESDINHIISHRSGETNDDFIADLAVGSSAPFIKVGGFSGGERMAKYNRLLMLADEIEGV